MLDSNDMKPRTGNKSVLREVRVVFMDWEVVWALWGAENHLSFDLGGITWLLETHTYLDIYVKSMEFHTYDLCTLQYICYTSVRGNFSKRLLYGSISSINNCANIPVESSVYFSLIKKKRYISSSPTLDFLLGWAGDLSVSH